MRSTLHFIVLWRIHDVWKALKDKAMFCDDKLVMNFRASLWQNMSFHFWEGCHDGKVKAITPAVWGKQLWTPRCIKPHVVLGPWKPWMMYVLFSHNFQTLKKKGYVQFNIPHYETAIFFDSRSLVSLGKKFILVHICRLIWRFHANAAHRHSMSDATVGAKSL